jgi:signal transduction histidine kinase/BarA-like signal transduction histidine kinase
MNQTPNTDFQLIADLFKHTDGPVSITDKTSKILFTNPAWSDALTVFSGKREIDRNEFIVDIVEQHRHGGVSKCLAVMNNRHYSFSVLSNDDYYIITGTDVSELVAEKDFFHEVLERLPADIGVFDTSGRYLYVNPVGIKDQALRNWIIGKTDFDYCNYRGKDTSMAESRKNIVEQIIATRQEQGYEEEIKKEGKESDWQLRKLCPVFDEHGDIKFILGYGINIAARKKAELAQKEALALIEISAKAKEDFVAVMSHEIRTPMNAIIGMSRILAKTKLDEQQSQYLEAILAASGNLIVIVNDILDFSKIEAGKLRLDPIGFSFSEVIGYAKAVTVQQALEKYLDLQFQLDDNIASVLIGDVYRINQVIVNLLNNAIKFTHHGKVTVSIGLDADNDTAQDISICVTDTGIGMNEAFLQQMFSMYSQEQGITREYGGTGLGLKITNQLVELMNGHIEVKSRKNEGTSIKVKLNLRKGTQADLPLKNTAVLHENSLEGKTILLAEDNMLNVLVASTVLKNNGANVIAAYNGKEAIDILKSQHIDAVLMDVEMPGMDGIAATLIIRNEMRSAVPVIALTANVMPEDRKKLADAGMDDFIAKPFAEADLIAALNNCLK